tara:strand:- start:831 stop:1025 length:195 start_codon:yes stop_codon:yes gene_type:complete
MKIKTKSLIKKTAMSSGDIKSFANNSGFRSWAKSNELATGKEIDGMSKTQLEKLYIQYMRSKGN